MKGDSNSTYPLVSIVSVNYNQPEATLDMLDSLSKLTYPNFEVIVVDNASTSGDISIIKKHHPGVQLIISDENLGFAGGNNLGIKASKGDYIMLLNNDTVVDPGFLEPLVHKFLSEPEAGAVSPKIIFHHTPGMIQYAGLSEINSFTIRNKGRGYGVMDTGQYDQDSKTFFAHGAAMMVPRKVIKEVGLMTEIFFLYYEEMDWVKRIRRAGYKVFYVHNSTIYHKESLSTGKNSPFKTYYMNRARLIYLRRNVKGITLVLAILFQCFVAIPKNLLFFLLSGRKDLFLAYVRAILWNIKNFTGKDLLKNPQLDK